MINKLILDQLDKLNIAQPSEYDEMRHQYTFKRIESIKLEEDKQYIVKLDKSLLDDTQSDVLMYNLNKGNFPKKQCMMINIMKKSGALVLVNGIYYDESTNTSLKECWSGWLQINAISVIREV